MTPFIICLTDITSSLSFLSVPFVSSFTWVHCILPLFLTTNQISLKTPVCDWPVLTFKSSTTQVLKVRHQIGLWPTSALPWITILEDMTPQVITRLTSLFTWWTASLYIFSHWGYITILAYCPLSHQAIQPDFRPFWCPYFCPFSLLLILYKLNQSHTLSKEWTVCRPCFFCSHYSSISWGVLPWQHGSAVPFF